MPEMDQNQFQAALRKYEKRKQKLANGVQPVPNPELKPESFKVNTALPFEPIYNKLPEKVKPAEQPRPRPKAMEVVISGPIDLKFTLDWSGTLLGGQMNKEALMVLFAKHLSPMGRVK